MRAKTLWIKDEYLEWILAGHKTVEVRVGYSNITRLLVGDQLLLNEKYRYVIRRIGRYASFAELLVNEDPCAIAPGMSAEDLLGRLKQLYPRKKEALGVLALEIQPED